MTGNDVAAQLGVSRRTLYRWLHEGRIACTDWTPERIEAKRQHLHKRQRGPMRNPRSKRYHEGRHSFERNRPTTPNGN